MNRLRPVAMLVLPCALLAASAVPAGAMRAGAVPAGAIAAGAPPAGAAAAGAAPVEHDPLTVHRSSPSHQSATLEQCVNSADQEERAATFSGEMTLLAGAARMEMRIDLLERGSGEEAWRRVTAPGLGVWRISAPGVKSFHYLKQVTNLAAPASYRGAVRFRWLNPAGHQIGYAEQRTRPCEETVVAAPSPAPGATLN